MWWKLLTGRPQDRQIDDEIEAHLRAAMQDRIDRGEAPEKAYRAARLELGNVTRVKEETRAVWRRPLLDQLFQDFRFAFRRLGSTPWSSGLAALLLAFGVGASAVAMTAVRAVLFPDLPFEEPNRVVVLHHRGASGGREMNFPGVLGPVDFFRLRDQQQLFQRVEGWTRTGATITGPNEAESALVEYVSEGLLNFVDGRPHLGRSFLEDEFEVGARLVVVVSDGLWRRHFGALSPVDEPLSLQVDGQPHLVVGVMPPGFQIPHPLRTDAWLPLRFTPDQKSDRRGLPITTLAELRPGASLHGVEAELNSFNSRVNQEFGIGPFRELRLIVTPIRDVLAGGLRPVLWTLTGAVGFVLLIACGSVAAMQVAQLLVRRRELAMRSALGATTGRLQRQLFVEALALYSPSAAGATVVAWAALRALQSSVPALLPGSPLPVAAVPGLAEATLDSATIAFILLAGICIAALVCIPVFGVVVLARSRDLIGSVRETSPIGGARFLRWLSVGQIAMTTALLIGAGLLLRGFEQLQAADAGFQREGIVSVRFPLARHTFRPGESAQHFIRMLALAETVPGVASAAFSLGLPINGPAQGFIPFEQGQSLDQGGLAPVGLETVSEGYFETLGVPLLAGRLFDSRDGPDRPAAVIVNKALADQFWPGEEVIGKRLRFREGAEIIAVVGNVKVFDAELGDRTHVDSVFLQSAPIAYQTIRQVANAPFGSILVRTNAEPESVAALIVGEARAAFPEQPIPTVRTMSSLYSAGLWRPRLAMRLMSGFALIAFLLTVGGVYGGVSYNVSRHTKEIGVRMALGATARQVVSAYLKDIAVMAAAGITIGAIAASVCLKALQSQIYGFSTTDSLIYLGATATTFLVSIGASFVAAIKGTRVAPLVALRHD